MKLIWLFLMVIFLVASFNLNAQLLQQNKFTHQDTLRGSITPERAWWDVLFYGITVKPDYNAKTIEGNIIINFRTLASGNTMQIDLQMPMQIGDVLWNHQKLIFKRDGNVYLVSFPSKLKKGSVESIGISFSGQPREAISPPWDGGWIWKKDQKGNPWMSVACQGLGASIWYPCKDHQSDEPDSASLTMIVPGDLVAVGNGRLQSKTTNSDGTVAYKWKVVNPINNYNIIPYIGKYVNWTSTFNGEKGVLDCSYWVLDYNLDTAKEQFKQVPLMLTCFEHWFGPYPFYEDSYKLVEAPHLGMEHQSAVAYGNKFRNGYLGNDLSGTGWGLLWDFIIVHESGHEWFGNNITSKDLGDMWIHESFTNYSETLFTTCQYGKDAGNDYVIGTRKKIVNKLPIIAPYGVNKEGSGDMYYKGGNMIHNIRTIIDDDELFRNILRELNKTFYHQAVTAKQVEDYISKQSGKDFSKVFEQYLLHTEIPVLEYKMGRNNISYRWTKCIKGFNMPVKIHLKNDQWINPTEQWQSMNATTTSELTVDPNFYIQTKKTE
jgi:aminopeptidase N